ncbi:MAG TPA: hypothetical protein VE973_00770 [Candidatus Limnocylindria bacterium]|nr:hypothetical protein [Candidatus Limnocylindria bacterium]
MKSYKIAVSFPVFAVSEEQAVFFISQAIKEAKVAFEIVEVKEN